MIFKVNLKHIKRPLTFYPFKAVQIFTVTTKSLVSTEVVSKSDFHDELVIG